MKKAKKQYKITSSSNNSFYVKFDNGREMYVECSYATENKISVTKFGRQTKPFSHDDKIVTI